MSNYSRRNFLKSIGGLSGAALLSESFDFKERRPLLSFSTLGCPDWAYPDIVSFAAVNGYNGIELRGLQRDLDLPKCKAFNTPGNINASAKLAKEKGIKIIALGSSAQLHHSEAKERMKNLDEAKRFIDLAHKLNCPFVRVFPNNFPKETAHDVTIELIAKGLEELGNYAKGAKVSVLMETHGDVVWSADIEKIMKMVQSPDTGLVWDIYNMWSVTKEPPAAVYEILKKYIRHSHIKDAKTIDGTEHYVLPGKGDSPIFEGIEALSKGGYRGYYSFEWEKMWHPEIDAPELVLPGYPKVMRDFFNNKKTN